MVAIISFTIYILYKVVTFSYLLPNQPPVRLCGGNKKKLGNYISYQSKKN